jgi:hypothetical protein
VINVGLIVRVLLAETKFINVGRGLEAKPSKTVKVTVTPLVFVIEGNGYITDVFRGTITLDG